MKPVGTKRFPHGTISGYQRGCRCEPCRQARRDYMRQWGMVNRDKRREYKRKQRGGGVAEPIVDRYDEPEDPMDRKLRDGFRLMRDDDD